MRGQSVERIIGGLIACVVLLLATATVRADDNVRTLCIFDPEGTQGIGVAAMRDAQLVMRRLGVNVHFEVYTEEEKALKSFLEQRCDAVNITGLRARQFNKFTGSIDSPGTIENYAEMRELVRMLASPKLAKYMISGPYEVVGVIPIGAGYPFVRDRSLNTLAKAAGKKIAVMDWDDAESMLVEQIGAVPIRANLDNYAKLFNTGKVDILIAPIFLYKPFELSIGLGSRGGIVRRPVIQLTTQMLIRRDRFAADFGQHIREYVALQVDQALGYIHNEENQVESRHWMYATTDQRQQFLELMRDARKQMIAAGIYDQRMINILSRVHCDHTPDDPSCADTPPEVVHTP